MPEGDTIYALAARLNEVLRGERVTRTTGDAQALRGFDAAGCCITNVSARGKHLMIHFDDGRVLRTHLRMQGRWTIVRGAQREHLTRRRHQVALHTAGCVAVCFRAPDVEVARSEARVRGARGLGPDLLDPNFGDAERDECVRRIRASGQPLGVALMDQRNLAGIGNVFKSELLFMQCLDPFRPLTPSGPSGCGDRLDETTLRDLVEVSRRWLVRNARSPGPRRTRYGEGPRLHVYRRAGQHCLTCGGRILMRRQGELRRSTYFCTACQRVTGP